jgi:hypothetical protein
MTRDLVVGAFGVTSTELNFGARDLFYLVPGLRLFIALQNAQSPMAATG